MDDKEGSPDSRGSRAPERIVAAMHKHRWLAFQAALGNVVVSAARLKPCSAQARTTHPGFVPQLAAVVALAAAVPDVVLSSIVHLVVTVAEADRGR